MEPNSTIWVRLVDIDTGQVLDERAFPEFERYRTVEWRPESSDARPGAFRVEFEIRADG